MAGKRDYRQEVLQQLSLSSQRGASRGRDEAVAEILGSQVGEVVANLYAITDDDEALQEAFRLSGLDPKNPYHWRAFLPHLPKRCSPVRAWEAAHGRGPTSGGTFFSPIMLL
jgi:hypothetical protein